MAEIRLATTELDRASMPPVCAMCGADANEFAKLNVLFRPRWVDWLWIGVIVFSLGWVPVMAIVMAFAAKLRLVELPVCERHHRRDRLRSRIEKSQAVTLLVAVGAGVLVAVLGIGDLDVVYAKALVGVALAGLISLIVVSVVLHRGWVRPGKTTPKSVLLLNVHEEFVEGVREERAAYYERLARESPDAVPTRPHPEIRDWEEDM